MKENEKTFSYEEVLNIVCVAVELANGNKENKFQIAQMVKDYAEQVIREELYKGHFCNPECINKEEVKKVIGFLKMSFNL